MLVERRGCMTGYYEYCGENKACVRIVADRGPRGNKRTEITEDQWSMGL